jgi:hypothetical protein
MGLWKVQIHRGWKMRDTWRAKSKAWSSSSLTPRGTVHKKFVPTGQTVNSAYCCDILRWLHENVRRLRPELWWQNNWLLHYDNPPSHTSFFTRKLHNKYNTTLISTHSNRLTWISAIIPLPWLKIRPFWQNWSDRGRIEGCAEHSKISDFRHVFENVGSAGSGAHARKGPLWG